MKVYEGIYFLTSRKPERTEKKQSAKINRKKKRKLGWKSVD